MLFDVLMKWTKVPHGVSTRRFLRNAHQARAVGWGLFAALLLILFEEAEAPMGWSIAVVCMGGIYPYVSTLLTVRSPRPLHWMSGSLFVESVIAILFAEMVCLDPVLVLVMVSVAGLNAGSTRGVRMALAVVCLEVLTLWAVAGRLRAVEHLELSLQFHILLGSFLLGYIVLVTHQVHTMVLRNNRDRRSLIRHQERIEGLHQHLVETISHPFMSDDEIVEIIGAELSDEQAQQYRTRIRDRQHLESLGRRADVVVHDIRNLLQPIHMIGGMLDDSVAGDPDGQELVSELNTATTRAHDILGTLDRRSEKRPDAAESCTVATVVTEAISLLRASNASGSEIHFQNQLSEPTTRVFLAGGQLHRVVMNLGLNALQAMQEPGRLSFSLSDVEPATEPYPLPPALGSTGCVALTVRDTGRGMSRDVRDRIFEPYFTTRGETGGTGLGLATTHAIVTDICGTIRVESVLGEGTTFRVLLPMQKGEKVAIRVPV